MKDAVGKGLAPVRSLAWALSLGASMLGAETTMVAPVSPSSDKLPPAREIIARYVQVIGGKEAILKYTAARGKGTAEFSGQGQNLVGELEILRAAPNKQVARIKMKDMGQIAGGYDGKTAWLMVPGQGPMVLAGKMLDKAREEAAFYFPLHEEADYQSQETVAITQFDGRVCYQLKLVFKSGRELTEFYDVETGLLLGYRTMQETLQASVEVTSHLSDYKRFGDMLQPTKLVHQMPGMEQIVTISSISYDPIPDREFELPAEVKALLKERPAK